MNNAKLCRQPVPKTLSKAVINYRKEKKSQHYAKPGGNSVFLPERRVPAVPGRAHACFSALLLSGKQNFPTPAKPSTPTQESATCSLRWQRKKKKKRKNEVPMSPGVSAGDTTGLKHFEVPWSITDTCRAPHTTLVPCSTLTPSHP